jgi:hypothetical protein
LLDLARSVGIILFDRHRKKLVGVVESGLELVENYHYLFELRTLLAERLGSLRFIPYVRLLEFALDLGQAFGFAFIVKDTPSTQLCVRQDRLWFV